MTRPARAVIDLSALQHNFNKIKEYAPDGRVMAVIKANAYGHGISAVAAALASTDAFGVASLEEALALRAAGIKQRIVLLEGLFAAEELQQAIASHLDIVVHQQQQLDMLAQAGPGDGIDVWLKIDTGMHRLGFAPEDMPDAYQVLQSLQSTGAVNHIRLMSHFACADDPGSRRTIDQLACFNRCLQAIGSQETECSLANSAAIVAWPDTHCDWVRPGIMLYGTSPLIERTASELGLLAVMTLKTELIAVKQCCKGEAVGYGGDWVCPQDMSIGIAAIGYGDGYPRHAPSGTPVLINGERASLAGRVSMDMIAIDLSAVSNVGIGDEVVLWGNGLPVDEVAKVAGTISYELLCHVSQRVIRDYV